jgi:alpha-ketoglutarate-dependent 2,4-dichlorophenoxyacetate dioxygenase
MDLQIDSLHEAFGAAMRGAQLAEPDEETMRALEAAIGRAGMLLFRDVGLDDAGLVAFARRFGPLQNMSSKPGEHLDVTQITNLDADGRMLPAGHAMRRQQDANELWHMDSTFRVPGATYSFLHARVIPDHGGDTEFCDTRVAFEALPAARRAELRTLSADHSIFHSRRLIGFEMTNYTAADLPPITRRLVRRHEPSGRDALIVASHIERVDGFDYAGGRSLVDELIAFATTPERVYRHRWRVGDLVIWDNRCILHRATAFSQFEQARDMRSCRVEDARDNGLTPV